MNVHCPRPGRVLALVGLFSSGALRAQSPPPNPGHSVHGEAFDEGPRKQATLLTGMGEISFPVTTRSPGAQTFFNQGVAQLHTFYYFEAERSFRQVAFLDPDCAMAYWGMAMANQNNGSRATAFLRKARERIAGCTPREVKYIEALEAYRDETRSQADRNKKYIEGLETVVLQNPEDIEARAFLTWAIVGGSWGGSPISSHVAVDLLLSEVLKKSPNHPGAHHYRIHLWDNRDPSQALESARAYARAAPGIAHAWHMPGHIYNGVSDWRRAVHQQIASARVDHQHMLENNILPFQIHNYAHNQHYLIANLSHLGAVQDAIGASRNLIETPRDPGNEGAQNLGRASLARVLLRYGRWDDLLTDRHLDWGDSPTDRATRAYYRGFAQLGKGDTAACTAELEALDAAVREAAGKGDPDPLLDTFRNELRGRLQVRQGKQLEGFALLQKAAETEKARFSGDLSGYPRPVLESAGEAHLEAQNWGLAEDCFRAVLDARHNTLVSLAGLAEARQRRGKTAEAREALGRFREAWKWADHDLPHLARLEALGIEVVTAEPDRPAKATFTSAAELADDGPPDLLPQPSGPRLWAPAPAPPFDLESTRGGKVSLGALRGRRVLVSFFLGSGCSHCVDQLVALAREKETWDRLGVEVLAVADEPTTSLTAFLATEKGRALNFPLLSDPGRTVARAYGAHDTFEDLSLHGVYLLDRSGGVRWYRVSAQPFTDLAFLKGELERWDRLGVDPPQKG